MRMQTLYSMCIEQSKIVGLRTSPADKIRNPRECRQAVSLDRQRSSREFVDDQLPVQLSDKSVVLSNIVDQGPVDAPRNVAAHLMVACLAFLDRVDKCPLED
jgi:hypothetical protein